MEKFIQKLTRLLRKHFPGGELDWGPRRDRLAGFLIWSGFVGREQIERQRAVRKVLMAELTPEEQQRVAAILTLTPDEMAAAREG